MLKKFVGLMIILSLIMIPSIAVAEEIDVNEFVRSVTVQIVVSVEKYTRSLDWYQEINADGSRSDWKVRYGKWDEPERIEVVGSGFIVYSGSVPYPRQVFPGILPAGLHGRFPEATSLSRQ